MEKFIVSMVELTPQCELPLGEKIMREATFQMIIDWLDISIFEVEYQHKAKNNLFWEKWMNASITRNRTYKLRQFIYKHTKIMLKSEFSEEFYNLVLKNFIRYSYPYFLEEMRKGSKDGEKNPLYRTVFFKLTHDELFVILANLMTWEHMTYPTFLENIMISEYRNREFAVEDINDIIRYYMRFLDVLSSARIVSILDLKALRDTIINDFPQLGKVSVNSLGLYKEWDVFNSESYLIRFPHFLENLTKKLYLSIPNM